MDDLISRQDFDKCLEDAEKESVKNRKYVFASALNMIRGNLRNFPSAEPEIIYCKDCRKYNIGIGDFEETEQGRHWYWKDEACPLVPYRGKAQGHEFDYQYCIFGKRRTDAET